MSRTDYKWAKVYPWAVFGFEQYYPQGGVGDLKGTFETEWEAEEFGKTLPYVHIEIEDLRKIMQEGGPRSE